MSERSTDVRSTGGGQCATRRQTALLFGLLLAVQLGMAALIPLGSQVHESSWAALWMMAFGAALTQPALLAVWAVFGPQRGALRLPMTLWLAAAGSLCVTFAVNQTAGENDSAALLMGGVLLAEFGVVQLPLWLIRALRGWQLERPASAVAASMTAAGGTSKATSQFSLKALLAAILAAALLLGGFRAQAPDVAMDQQQIFGTFLEAGLAGLVAAVCALPVVAMAWIVLADGRRLALRIVLSVLVLVGLATACTLLGLVNAGAVLLHEGGVLPNALVCFATIRNCGYRLRRRSKNVAAAEPLAPAPVSRVRFAFALAPLAVLAVTLAASIPGRIAQWRRADISAAWRSYNLEASFAADGAIYRFKYCQPAPISDEQCRLIASVGTLRSLALSHSALDDRQLALLAPLGRLERLDLTGTAVTDAGLKHLAHFPQIVALDLANTPITDAGLRRLQALPLLGELTFSLTEATDEGLSALDALPALRSVDATLTAVTSEGAERLRQTHPLAKVDFGASDALLTGGPKLRREYITQRTALGYGATDLVIKLKRLHARGNTTSNGVAGGVTDAGLVTLAAVQTELEELDLRDSAVTDKGLISLRALTSLKRLDLRGSKVTAQGAESLARVLSNCEILR